MEILLGGLLGGTVIFLVWRNRRCAEAFDQVLENWTDVRDNRKYVVRYKKPDDSVVAGVIAPLRYHDMEGEVLVEAFCKRRQKPSMYVSSRFVSVRDAITDVIIDDLAVHISRA